MQVLIKDYIDYENTNVDYERFEGDSLVDQFLEVVDDVRSLSPNMISYFALFDIIFVSATTSWTPHVPLTRTALMAPPATCPVSTLHCFSGSFLLDLTWHM